MSLTPVYEKNLSTSLCYVDTIQLNEFNNSIYDTGYTYSGITLVLNLTNFTTHFNTTGHTYSNVILNNDIYSYTGLTGETHYFEIYDFYSGGTPSIDPLLTGLTEADVISGFTTTILPCSRQLEYSGNCCPTEVVKLNLPWVARTNTGNGADYCEPFIERREHLGWTLDYVFNKNGVTGWTESVFFFTGVRDEYDPANYGDNNLSFRFTDDGRIKWTAYRYSGYCDSVSGYTPMYYISTGQTLPLCVNGTSNDFEITIAFERYYEYSGCSLANEGGWNDLINTGYTSTTGSTIVGDFPAEQLSQKWLKERHKRLGTLKLYHNGRPLEIDDVHSSIRNFRNVPVYKVKDFEEIVLSDRGFQPFTHVIGGGVTGSGGIHEGVCCYSIKYDAYFDFPIQYIDVRGRYLDVIKTHYNIVECNDPCADVLVYFTPLPSHTPSSTPTPSISITPSSTPSITPTTSSTPSITPTPSMSPTPSITPSLTPSPTTTPAYTTINPGDVIEIPSNITSMQFLYNGAEDTTADVIISGITFTIAATYGDPNAEFIWDYYDVNGNFYNFGQGDSGSIDIIIYNNIFTVSFVRGSLFFTLINLGPVPSPTPSATISITPSISVSARPPIYDLDGNAYNTVVIGTQEWFVQNLMTTQYADATPITQIFTNGSWSSDTTGAVGFFNNNVANKAAYGGYYNWFAVNNVHGLAPTGWRVATDSDWATLLAYLGGEIYAGGKLKKTGTGGASLWTAPNYMATNETGFSAVASGNRNFSAGTFLNSGLYSSIWSSTVADPGKAWYYYMEYDTPSVTRFNGLNNFGFSVRCVRDV